MLLGALSALGGLSAGSVPNAAAQARGAARQGEAYTFSLRVLGSFDAGRARMAVSPPVASPGGPIVNIIAEAEATGFAKALTGLHEDYRLVLDAATLLPRRLQLIESGLRNRTAVIEVTDRRVDIHVTQPPLEKRWSGVLPSQPVEPLTVLLLLRAARLRNGDKLELILMDGSAFYLGTMEVVAREELVTGIGRRKAIKILCRGERINENGVKINRPMRSAIIWVSDDPARLPLRVEGQTELGTAEFVLTGYESGRRPLLTPKKLLGMVERAAAVPGAAPGAAPGATLGAAPGSAPAAGTAPAPKSTPAPGTTSATKPAPGAGTMPATGSAPAPGAAPAPKPAPAPGTTPAPRPAPAVGVPPASRPTSAAGAAATPGQAPVPAAAAAPAATPAPPAAPAPVQ